MKTTQTNMNEAQANAKLDLGNKKPEAIGKARHTLDAIKANPDYATKPDVQKATIALAAATDALDDNLKALAALRSQEKSLLTSQILLNAAFKRYARSIVAVIDETTEGSADGIRKWGLDV